MLRVKIYTLTLIACERLKRKKNAEQKNVTERVDEPLKNAFDAKWSEGEEWNAILIKFNNFSSSLFSTFLHDNRI